MRMAGPGSSAKKMASGGRPPCGRKGTGPAELSKKAARQSRPPVDRSNPHRKKRDGPGPDKGSGSGPPGAGSAK